jgi:hypothetical protein
MKATEIAKAAKLINILLFIFFFLPFFISGFAFKFPIGAILHDLPIPRAKSISGCLPAYLSSRIHNLFPLHGNLLGNPSNLFIIAKDLPRKAKNGTRLISIDS